MAESAELKVNLLCLLACRVDVSVTETWILTPHHSWYSTAKSWVGLLWKYMMNKQLSRRNQNTVSLRLSALALALLLLPTFPLDFPCGSPYQNLIYRFHYGLNRNDCQCFKFNKAAVSATFYYFYTTVRTVICWKMGHVYSLEEKRTLTWNIASFFVWMVLSDSKSCYIIMLGKYIYLKIHREG